MKKRPPDFGEAVAVPASFSFRQWHASPVLLVIGVWLLLHPYIGIAHDARLYAVQALHELAPEIFGRDMFFAFGSQDAFTLFSKLYAPLVDIAGLSAAAMAMVAVGQAVLLGGAAALAMRLAESRAAAIVGLLLLAVMPGTYGGWQLLTVAEGFATPRLLAEGLGLWALWALSCRRMIMAGLLILASAALHPIMSAAVVLAGALFLILGDRRWLVPVLVGVVAMVIGAYLGVPPLDRLLQTMDTEWLEILQRSIYLYPGEWRARDWGGFAFALTLALGGAIALSGWRRALVCCVAAAAVIGVGANYVGADLLHNVLLTQLQLYRTMWLLNVVAYLAAGTLLVRIWRLEDGWAIVALLLLGSIVTFTALPLFGVVIVATCLLLAHLRLSDRLRPLPVTVRILAISLAALLAAGLIVFRASSLHRLITEIVMPGHASIGTFAFVTVIDVGIIAVGLLVLLRYQPNLLRAAMPVVAFVLFAGSLLVWDRRDEWSRVMGATETASGPDWPLPADAQVFWESTPIGPWMILGRASYVSPAQGAATVFVRDMAIAYRDRSGVVEPIMQTEMVDLFRNEAAAHRALPLLDRPALVTVCDRDPTLDALVLSRAVEGSYAATWDPPIPIYDTWSVLRGIPRPSIQRFYLYECQALRSVPAGQDRLAGEITRRSADSSQR